jgi:hypothetical protein
VKSQENVVVVQLKITLRSWHGPCRSRERLVRDFIDN